MGNNSEFTRIFDLATSDWGRMPGCIPRIRYPGNCTVDPDQEAYAPIAKQKGTYSLVFYFAKVIEYQEAYFEISVQNKLIFISPLYSERPLSSNRIRDYPADIKRFSEDLQLIVDAIRDPVNAPALIALPKVLPLMDYLLR